MAIAANRFGKVVQVGTMNRSRPKVREAIKFIQDGGIGKTVPGTRALLQEARPYRQIPGWPAELRRAIPS